MAEKKMLQHKGASKKTQGHEGGRSHSADTREAKNAKLSDRGPGSAFASGLLREEAQRVKAEKKVPGALGYKVPVDTSKWTHRDSKKKK